MRDRKREQSNYQAPEIFHLQAAVDAVKRALQPEIAKQPTRETIDTELEEQAETGPIE